MAGVVGIAGAFGVGFGACDGGIGMGAVLEVGVGMTTYSPNVMFEKSNLMSNIYGAITYSTIYF